ncbi:MAG: lysophospholipase L1 and related esterase-like protein [Rhodobacteraceae bacterium]|uniref:DUF1489 family protein n=1 Tax=Cypionkella sp. TaxID=2811411 RepID=UPI001329745F|nr:DUF1489 domain-containing protein [Cypionkella sp.]KAF0174292.1 MAG: lysophospholipase L1 and related esterase-like protein [Paracoccaceae bacterium]MDO8326663.1 DUF1489 domain-containing protein [Cypionkella sp.]
MGQLNIIKLCVGAESVEDLADWHRAHAHVWAAGTTEHVTRMWPKRDEELLKGGSLFWVIKGVVQARQRLLGLAERRGGDGILRCAMVLDAEIIRTENALRRPFQGWRYLDGDEAPRDLPKGRAMDDALPPELAQALAEIGLR